MSLGGSMALPVRVLPRPGPRILLPVVVELCASAARTWEPRSSLFVSNQDKITQR